jgi:hypothetical protein
VKIITEDGILKDFALLYEIDNDTLELIRSDKDYFSNPDKVKILTTSNGNNALIIMLQCRQGVGIILRRLRDLLKEYESVSWYNREHKQFRTIRR